ncbi:MAG TPA: hypothetical protein VMS65_17155 [Polyangiaceae bacterium]|nr:hypothetical protein [Polyangiaceae bacterium]
MRLLAGVVLGSLTVAGAVSVASASDVPGTPGILSDGLTQPAFAEIDRALGFGLASVSPAYEPKLDAPKRLVTPSGRVVSLPNGCRTASRPFDLLIHFHGAPTAVEPAFERSGIDGVLGIVNLGIGSGAYETALQMPGSFDEVVQRFTIAVHEMCPGSTAAPKRIALSGWSAGYGAVFRVLDRQRDASRVDAVLLADGLHASIDPTNKYERHVMVDQMAPFTAFADEAVAGNKLFAITHSQIQTPYASTTETTDFLLAQEGVTRAAPNLAPPRPGMVMTSRGDAAGFHVLGFSGGNEKAHCDHLHAFGETLLPYLKERWSTPD